MASTLKRRSLVPIINEIFLDNEDEDEMICAIVKAAYMKSKRARVCNENYMSTVMNYSLSDFKNHFRLTKCTVATILTAHGSEIYHQTYKGGRESCPQKQLLVTLWILANQEVYRVINVLIRNVKKYIYWPTNYRKVSQEFAKRAKFPNVIGAIDGTHIPICTPQYGSNGYVNRNKYHSIVLQAVCDANYKFINCYAGCPGSVHDARVFKKSPLFIQIHEEGLINEEYHLLGDSAYACTDFMITPYKDNGLLSARQKKFNTLHSVTRVCIEQSFGLLKGRFRMLKYVNAYKTENIPKIIIACCILHTICMEYEVNDILNLSTPIILEDDQTPMTQFSKRDKICNALFDT